MSFQLAQDNIACLVAPIASDQLVDFVSSLDDVNASAQQAPGFVWRLKTESGNAISIVAFEWDVHENAGVIVNLSAWETIEDLTEWIQGPLHRAVMLQRRRWFERVSEATTALWWVSEGHSPSTLEAESRLLHLRQHGPTPTAFSFKERFAPPS
jgi:hypothetical protein